MVVELETAVPLQTVCANCDNVQLFSSDVLDNVEQVVILPVSTRCTTNTALFLDFVSFIYMI